MKQGTGLVVAAIIMVLGGIIIALLNTGRRIVVELPSQLMPAPMSSDPSPPANSSQPTPLPVSSEPTHLSSEYDFYMANDSSVVKDSLDPSTRLYSDYVAAPDDPAQEPCEGVKGSTLSAG